MPRIFDLRKLALSVGLLALLGFVPSIAKADTITASCVGNTCTVNQLNGQGLGVNATATFVFGAGTINVTLTNNLTAAQMISVNQAITGLVFTVSTGQTAGTLTTSNGSFTNIAANGTGALAGSGPTGWILQNNPLTICVICAPANAPAGPEQAIIGGNGVGPYANANGSIAGNNPHNPFLFGPVTFSLSVPGVTADTVVSTVQIRFNTEIAGTSQVPEPASMLLLGTGILGIAGAMRRRLKK